MAVETKPRKNIKNILTKEFLIEHYIRQRKSTSIIQREFDIPSHTSIRYYLRKYNIRCRDWKESMDLIQDTRCMKNRKGFMEITGSHWSAIRSQAKNRGIDFDITIEDAWNKFIEQNRKCALTGEILTFPSGYSVKYRNTRTASLDRINSFKGYHIDNIQWIHKKIQHLKISLNNEELFMFCKAIYLHNRNKFE